MMRFADMGMKGSQGKGDMLICLLERWVWLGNDWSFICWFLRKSKYCNKYTYKKAASLGQVVIVITVVLGQ